MSAWEAHEMACLMADQKRQKPKPQPKPEGSK